MVKIMENPIEMDDLGVLTIIFGNIHFYTFPIFPYPKNHGISRLVVWRSQNPAIQIQTPL